MSDAMSHIAASERINKVGNELAIAQKKFLVKPCAENLKGIYNACDRFGNCSSGYWGENPKVTAEKIRRYYQTRFHQAPYNAHTVDIAFFLQTIVQDRRIQELSDILAMSQGIDPSDKKFIEKSVKIWSDLDERLNFSQRTYLEKTVEISGIHLDQILSGSGIREKYNFP